MHRRGFLGMLSAVVAAPLAPTPARPDAPLTVALKLDPAIDARLRAMEAQVRQLEVTVTTSLKPAALARGVSEEIMRSMKQSPRWTR